MATFLIVLGVILAVVLVLGVIVVVIMLRLGATVEAEVYAAVNEGQYQFVALMEPDGPILYPKVEGIPDWYLETSGLVIKQTTPETKEQDLAYMKKYNELMRKTLKEDGKWHVIEENIEIVRKNLGKKNE